MQHVLTWNSCRQVTSIDLQSDWHMYVQIPLQLVGTVSTNRWAWSHQTLFSSWGVGPGDKTITHLACMGRFCAMSFMTLSRSSGGELMMRWAAWKPRSCSCHTFSSAISLAPWTKWDRNSSNFSFRSGYRDLHVCGRVYVYKDKPKVN